MKINMPSSSGEFLFKGCPKNLLSLMTFLTETWKLFSRLVNWQVWSIWSLLCIRIKWLKKNYQQRYLAGVNFCFTKWCKNLLILMTFLPEAWKLLVNWQVWSIWNLLCICISDCEKNEQQRHLAGVNFWFTKYCKNLLILMTFLPECQLALWKLLSMLVYWQVWSIWNLLFVSATVKKNSLCN